jgi:hypothetical protein
MVLEWHKHCIDVSKDYIQLSTTASARPAVGRSENPAAAGRLGTVTGPNLPLSRFARAPESPSRILESLWLAFSPSALGFPRALGFSDSGPRGISRRIPAQVLSCTYAPPQWRTLTRVALRKRPSRPGLFDKAPRTGPRPFSISRRKNPFFHSAFAERSNGVATPFESPAFRVWLPSWRREPFRPREPFQLPTLMGFALQGFDPTSWPARRFRRAFRSCASVPNRPAWQRRSSGFRLRGQQCLPRSPPFYQRRVWPLPS